MDFYGKTTICSALFVNWRGEINLFYFAKNKKIKTQTKITIEYLQQNRDLDVTLKITMQSVTFEQMSVFY